MMDAGKEFQITILAGKRESWNFWYGRMVEDILKYGLSCWLVWGVTD
jgi:hypothetical protein